MTNNTPQRENHYNRLVELVGGLEAIEGLGRDFTSEDIRERAIARANAKRVYAGDNQVPETHIEDISNGVLEGHLGTKLERATIDTREYFGQHRDEIIESIPKTKLEKAVIDYLPQLGISPLSKEDGKLGELSKMHEVYLRTRETFEKYVNGKPIADDSKTEIKGIAARAFRSEARKELIEAGYDPNKHSTLFLLSESSAGELAYHVDRNTVAAYASRALDDLRSELKKGIKDNYEGGIEQYSRDLISKHAERDSLGTARAISVLDRTQFK